MWQRFAIGARHNRRHIFRWILSAWGTAWLFVNSLSFIFSEIKHVLDQYSLLVFIGFAVCAICNVLWNLPAVEVIELQVPASNTKIEITFGNLFEKDGHVAIPVAEYFDTQIGDAVDQNSVHGQFIEKVYGGDSLRLQKDLDALLKTSLSNLKLRSDGRDRAYPIGTTAAISSGATKYYLFALAETDQSTFKARATATQMLHALDGLWNVVRATSAGKTINIPLVGGGQSHVGLSPLHLVRLILLSVLLSTRASEITKKIRIVLHPSTMNLIDLGSIRREGI